MAEEVPSPGTIAATPPTVKAAAFAPSSLRGWAMLQRAVNFTLPQALAKSAEFRVQTQRTLSRLG